MGENECAVVFLVAFFFVVRFDDFREITMVAFKGIYLSLPCPTAPWEMEGLCLILILSFFNGTSRTSEDTACRCRQTHTDPYQGEY